MLTELLLLGAAALVGKAALDDPEGFKNDLKKAAAKQQAENAKKAAERAQNEKNRAYQLYRQGCSCFNCTHCNANGYCESLSSEFDHLNDAEKQNGVKCCSSWTKR